MEPVRQTELWVVETNSADETFSLGERIGEAVRPGTVITLGGDLGAGKTVMAQGIAEGLGIDEPVCSPTFTIAQEYDKGRLPLYHLDVYRLADISEMDEIGYEDYFYGDGVAVIEWAERIEELLPEHYVKIAIEREPEKGFDYRRITIEKR